MPAPKIPSMSNYLKLSEGDTTFRILSPVITGFEYWNTEKRPIRLKAEPIGIPSDLGQNEGKPNPIRYFWAFVVWNYKEERVQIAEFTQKTILVPIEALWNNGKWGDPMNYDITITKKGTTLNDTEYSVVPNPKEKVDPKIQEAYKNRPIDLEALYRGEDPFAGETKMKPAISPQDYPPSINSSDIPF